MVRSASLLTLTTALLLPGYAQAGLSRALAAPGVPGDSIRNVWVVFADRPTPVRAPLIAPHAETRRKAARYPLRSERDYPVSADYVGAVTRTGARLRHTFSWANAASFSVRSDRLAAVAALPGVKHVLPVAMHRRILLKQNTVPGFRKSMRSLYPTVHGEALEQAAMLGVPRMQAYIHRTLGRAPGDSVIIGMFDTGFWLDHDCFGHVRAPGRIVADSDFVDGTPNPYYNYPDHGSETMSTIAGFDPGSFMGTAWGARFILARTENDFDEEHIEEDHWAAAMVWAEAMGVDIVSSSLGYFTGFSDSLGDYQFEDMDGNTTIISVAAREATKRGVLVVNAMGNRDSQSELLVNAPADVEDVISVGAVDADMRIATFSCRGPTADGRLKPDLVAMGDDAVVVANAGYRTSDGTSFSTPLIAGVVALVRQLYPADAADAIRQRLYASCRFTPFQTSVDTVYGRGVPDLSTLAGDSNDLYLCVVDTLGRPVRGARVYRGASAVDSTDTLGYAVIGLGGRVLPDTVEVGHDSYARTRVVIDSLFGWRSITLRSGYSLSVTIVSASDSVLLDGTLYWRELGAASFDSIAVARGIGAVAFAAAADYEVFVSAPFHYSSDTIAFRAEYESDTLSFTPPPWRSLTVSFGDSLGNRITEGTLHWKPLTAAAHYSTPVGSSGTAVLWYARPELHEIMVVSPMHKTFVTRIDPDTVSGSHFHVIMARGKVAVIQAIDSATGSTILASSVVWWQRDSLTTYTTTANAEGRIALDLDHDGRYLYYVQAGTYAPGDTASFHSDSVRDTISVALAPLRQVIHVMLTDTSDSAWAVSPGIVYARRSDQEKFTAYAVDSAGGTASVPALPRRTYVLYAAAPGYEQSNEVTIATGELPDTVRIALEPRSASRLAVYPNVVSIRRLKRGGTAAPRGVSIDFLANPDNPRKYSQVCRVAVRTVTGDLVWEFSTVLEERKPVRDKVGGPLVWTCRSRGGEFVSPGMYIVTVEYANDVHTSKVLVTG